MLNRISLASLLNTIFYEKVDCLKLPPDWTRFEWFQTPAFNKNYIMNCVQINELAERSASLLG